ncbi:MAG: efflux RND transporter periplasmic adaptor subunit [Planctomycetota bacterium]
MTGLNVGDKLRTPRTIWGPNARRQHVLRRARNWLAVAVATSGVTVSLWAIAQDGPAKPAASGSSLQRSGAATSKAPSGARISRAVVLAIEDIQVPAKQAGELAELHVDEGTVVEQGAVLAQIDDAVAKAKKATAEAELRIAKAQAASDAKVKAADDVARYQEAEYQVNEELFRRNVVSNAELRKFKVQFERAKSETDVARLEDRVADLTEEGKNALLEQTQIELTNFQVVARLKEPGKAVIVEVDKHVGDWVQLGESIMRIVRMDAVRVQGYLNVADFSPREVEDQPVTIEVSETIGGKSVTRSVTAKLDYVSPVIEPGGDYRVWAKVKNPQVGERDWLLRPGSNVTMTIQIKPLATDSAQ